MDTRRLKCWKGQTLEPVWSIKCTKVCSNCQGAGPEALGGLKWDSMHLLSNTENERSRILNHTFLSTNTPCLTSVIKRSGSEIGQMELGFMTIFYFFFFFVEEEIWNMNGIKRYAMSPFVLPFPSYWLDVSFVRISQHREKLSTLGGKKNPWLVRRIQGFWGLILFLPLE